MEAITLLHDVQETISTYMFLLAVFWISRIVISGYFRSVQWNIRCGFITQKKPSPSVGIARLLATEHIAGFYCWFSKYTELWVLNSCASKVAWGWSSQIDSLAPALLPVPRFALAPRFPEVQKRHNYWTATRLILGHEVNFLEFLGENSWKGRTNVTLNRDV